MERRKRKLIGAALLLLGAVTIFITMTLAERAMRQEADRNLAMSQIEARSHPGTGGGVSAPEYPQTAYIPNIFGGLLILAGVLILSGKLRGTKTTPLPAPVPGRR